MMKPSTAFLLISTLFYPRFMRAFTVNFNSDASCNGTELGSLPVWNDTKCHTDFANQASGITVNSNASDVGDAVVFYFTDDCDPTYQMALTNTEMCVSTTYQSFQVLGIDDCCLDDSWFHEDIFGGDSPDAYATVADTISVSTINPTPTSLPSFYRDTGAPTLKRRNLPEPATPSVGPEPSQFGGDQPTFYHGAIRIFHNRPYKMHQIAHGSWMGVEPDAWDDNVHVKSDAELDYRVTEPSGKEPSQPISTSTALSPLQERALIWGKCNAALECSFRLGGNLVFGVIGQMDRFIDSAKAGLALISANREAIWDFLNKPFVSQITVGTGAAILGGYISGQTMKTKSRVAQCSDKHSDADVIKSAVQQIAKAAFLRKEGDVTDASFRITLPNGETVTFDVSTRTNGDNTQAICGAPNRED